MPAEKLVSYSLRQLVMYFLRLGYSGFGGPVTLVGYMHSDLVEYHKWMQAIFYCVGAAVVGIIAISS
jgi:chromate transporter